MSAPTPDEMMGVTALAALVWRDQDVLQLWPGARGELGGLAAHLERTGATMTASQLLMAIGLGDRLYGELQKACDPPEAEHDVRAQLAKISRVLTALRNAENDSSRGSAIAKRLLDDALALPLMKLVEES